MTLSKSHRLAKRKDIAFVLKKGRRVPGNFFTVKIAQTGSRTRFAIVVASRVAKRAAERNKIRRKISEAIRRTMHLWKTGCDVVFLAEPAIIKAHYRDIEAAVREVSGHA